MTLPSGTGAPIGEPLPTDAAAAVPARLIWAIPVLIGLGAATSVVLHAIGIFGAMVHPAVGFTIGGLTLVAGAVGYAAVYRGWTGRWHPVIASLLALLTALAVWGPVVGFLPMAFGLLSTVEAPVITGIVVGALATLVLPGRWRIAGWIAAGLLFLLSLAAFAPVVLEGWSELLDRG